ncbi:DUF3329 domain-containing protein [Sinirhodobacter sp. WL0062]|uniref:DUF3329 domain-containing protein n=1 Tax=Rhodobacter flavimaris TaxID=2907145 RepID=A0ABS8YYH8_9RHOB|nr:DUF3329 domain-containing protein [Sinirhodobacter sp. WL0062]MCE5974872.1 DUF3329 domain-containing protein [Sinirhodobacter sp. WL0062]
MFDLDDPWFRPLWLRIAVVGVCIGWGIFEALGGNSGWAMLFLAAGGYAAWRFFVTFNPGEDE